MGDPCGYLAKQLRIEEAKCDALRAEIAALIEWQREASDKLVSLTQTAVAATERAEKAEKLLRDTLPYAEWHDKHVHFCSGETYQYWWVPVMLPVELTEPDKSPEAALERALRLTT